jgi:hypothetical protein
MLLLVLHVLVLLLLPDTSGCCIETVHKPQLLLPRFTPPSLHLVHKATCWRALTAAFTVNEPLLPLLLLLLQMNSRPLPPTS